MHRKIRGLIIAVLGFGWELLNIWHLLDFVVAKLQAQEQAGNLVVTVLVNPLFGLVLIIGGLILFARDKGHKKGKVNDQTKTVVVLTPNEGEKAVAGRIFVGPQITPEYLVGFFDGHHTGAQASVAAQPFIGKFMKLSGPVTEVGRRETFGAVSFSSNRTSITMFFAVAWSDRLLMLRRGEKTVVIGRISQVGYDGLRLDNCELVDSTNPALPAPHVDAAATPQTERVYLRESIKEVVNRIKSLKPLEKTEVSNQSYVGRWVRWSGRVLSIEPFAIGLPSGSATVTVSDSEFIYARLEYLPAQRHLVEPIEVGDAIDYQARVTKVFDGNIYLTDATVAATKPVMVEVTPEYLWGLCEGRTSAQVEQRVADYIGKWMPVSGPLGDVKPSGQVTFQHARNSHRGLYVFPQEAMA